MSSIREPPAAAGTKGAQRPLPASGNLTAEARALPVGEVVAARVVAGEGGVDLLLELAGQRVSVPPRLDLPAGSTVAVRVERSGEGLRLTPVTSDAAPSLPAAVAEALRQALPRQGSLASLLPLLARLTAGTASSAPPAPAPAAFPATTPAGAAPAAAGAALPGFGEHVSTVPGASAASAASAAGAAGADGDGAPPGTGSPAPPATRFEASASPSLPATAPADDPGRVQHLPSLESLLLQSTQRPQPFAQEGTPLPSAALAARLVAAGDGRPAGNAGTSVATLSPATAGAGAGAGAGHHPGRAGIASSGAGSGGDADTARLARLAAAAADLPLRVAAALSALADQVPAVADLRDGSRIARAVARAGLMLEAHLAARGVPADADIAADLKAALLRVRASVDEDGRPREGATSPGQPASATEAGRAALLQALGDSVDGTLARITVNQLQAVSVADTGPLAFSFEIPLRDADGRYQPLQFEFEREAEDPAGGRAPTSTVTLRMQPPGLGPVTAVLRLGGEQIATELWAAEPRTRALLFHTSDRLAARLRGAGLGVAAIRLCEQPPRRPPSSIGGARSLIETKV